ncbi:hypothetical protein [uncultured Brachyspira sp.]|uniref:hypothetical protein n=1 Tax=uncultured Brachyspira sp. TaxID=221953 RepID=UPI002603BD16|nr:hypothetical protein [uncultured Brachyspira sp.]
MSSISDNSVGDFSAYLLAMNNYSIYEKVWKEKILTAKDFNIYKSFLFGIFSRYRLIEIIDKYIDLNLISDYHFFMFKV